MLLLRVILISTLLLAVAAAVDAVGSVTVGDVAVILCSCLGYVALRSTAVFDIAVLCVLLL